MRHHRDLKIGSLIQEELSKILARDFYVEGALVTVVDVRVDPDLLHARVKVAIIPYGKGLEVFKELEKNRRKFQHQLFKKMNLKPMPQIKFEIAEE